MKRGIAADGSPTARYGVIGNPVAHSLSPQIHAAFAARSALALDYVRVDSPVDRFRESVDAFRQEGGRGLNVTLPFKIEAHDACGRLSARARQAGAVNWLGFEDGTLLGDNTDGAGLVRDLDRLLHLNGRTLAGARILMLGAGGAARGVVGPLLACNPGSMVIANRDRSRAAAIASEASSPILEACSFGDVGGESFDVIVNATSASLAGQSIPLASGVLASAAFVYDMMYGAEPTAFLVEARRAGATTMADGLGMLVEQAAESFFLWHGIRPETGSVLRSLRASIETRAAR